VHFSIRGRNIDSSTPLAKLCHVWLFGLFEPLVEMLSGQSAERTPQKFNEFKKK